MQSTFFEVTRIYSSNIQLPSIEMVQDKTKSKVFHEIFEVH